VIYQRQAATSVDEVLGRIEQAAAAHKFGVLCTHDLKQKMNAKGVDFARECRVVEICNPWKAKTVLETDPVISNALPCRISVFEDNDGAVQVTMLKPTQLMKLFGHPQLEETAQEVERTMAAIIDAACAVESATA